jgi:aspartyl-tRNA(Asn)/glutamyl-tRNA(Gln) amidotransferase subunit A
VGLKTTVGRIGRTGVYPLSFSLDSVGPLARTVEDAAIVYQHLTGEDEGDETTSGIPSHDVLRGLKRGVKGLRLAFAETVFFDDADPEIAKSVRESGRVLKDLGASVESVAFPEAAEAVKLNPRGLVISAEAYAVNQRFLEEQFDALDPVIRERMKNGKLVTGPEYFQITRRWAALRKEADRGLAHIDALLVPTTVLQPLPVAPLAANLDMYLQRNAQYLRNTAIGNILRLCGLSLPCGFTSQGFPVGLMIYGKGFAEDTVLRIGHAYEQATPWHTRRPDLSWAA